MEGGIDLNNIALGLQNGEEENDGMKKYAKTAEYDPYQTPADLIKARKHGKAKRVYVSKKEDKYEEKGREVCPCCSLPVEGEPIPLTAGLEKLYHLGSGFALYFRFIKYSIAILFLMFLCSGLYNLITNYVSEDCDTGDDGYCIQGYILTYALPNKRNEKDLLSIQLGLNLASVILMMLFFHYLRFQFRKTEIEADDKTVTPSDYTIVIEGVPIETTNEEIEQWIQSLATPEMPLEIEKINRTFDILSYKALHDQLHHVQEAKENHEKKHKISEKDTKTEQLLEAKIAQIKNQIQKLKNGEIKRTPIVYVTFRTAQQSNYVESKFEKPLLAKIFGYFVSTFVNTFDKIKGRRVQVSRAPEPSDILWLNLAFSPGQRKKKMLFTNIITSILIILGFGVIILVNWGQDRAIHAFGEKSKTVQGLSILASIVIVVINTVLAMSIDYLTQFEKHLTNTEYLQGVSQKLSVAQFVNTALTTLVAKLILSTSDSSNTKSGLETINFYGKGGLLENIYWVFITNALLTPFLTLLDIPYLLKAFQRNRVLKQNPNKLTQKQAHDLFENPTLVMPAKNAAIIKIMLMATLYAPALPFALIYTIVGLFLCYWADKYVLLRRSGLPNSLDDEVTDAMVEYLEWAACTFAVGNIFYVFTLRDSTGNYAFDENHFVLIWITLGISLFHIIFPMEILNNKLFPIDDKVTENLTYSEARVDFTTDYDIENPLTREPALKSFMEMIKGTSKTPSPNKREAYARAVTNQNIQITKYPKIDFSSLDMYLDRTIAHNVHRHEESPVAKKKIVADTTPHSNLTPVEIKNTTPRNDETKQELVSKLDEHKMLEELPTQRQQGLRSEERIQEHAHEAHKKGAFYGVSENPYELNSDENAFLKEKSPNEEIVELIQEKSHHEDIIEYVPEKGEAHSSEEIGKPQESEQRFCNMPENDSANLSESQCIEALDLHKREVTVNRSLARRNY